MNDEDKLGLGCFLALVLLALPSCFGASKLEVSDGTRDVTIRKLSHSGFLFRTHELTATGIEDQMVAEQLHFTVRDPAVLEKVKALPPGTRVRIHYRKYLTAWQPNGESRYELTGVDR